MNHGDRPAPNAQGTRSPVLATRLQPVRVPGAVTGGYTRHQRYRKLPMVRVLAPAIEYADKAFPISEISAGRWQRPEQRLRATPDAARNFLVDGRAPRHGD